MMPPLHIDDHVVTADTPMHSQHHAMQHQNVFSGMHDDHENFQ
jgi:hypothetical protein